MRVQHLRTEYLVNPLGLGERRPRLSWQLADPRRGAAQSAFRIRVAETGAALDDSGALLWDSGRVTSGRSVHVRYSGSELRSRQRCSWQVRVWDETGTASEWSPAASWEMGLLEPNEWQAHWIEPALEQKDWDAGRAPRLRRAFALAGEDVSHARLYLSSLGLHLAELNGQPVGDHLFAPGWTAYRKRLQVESYDVTDLLRTGDNVVGVTLGDGWYRGPQGFADTRAAYGDRLALLLQLEIEYRDGRMQTVGSDRRWRSSTGPIRSSGLHAGEHYDARHEQPGWSRPGFDDRGWAAVEAADHGKDILVARTGPPVRRILELPAREILYTPAGETVVDFGQNLVGWVRLEASGPTGTEIRLRHAEVLDRDGNLYTANLRGAAQLDRYTLAGRGREVFEPHFTFHGFRYVALEGYPGKLEPECLTAIVIHSDLDKTGKLETSDPRLDRLVQNVVWSQRGNFLDVPTDCPQRNERLGWTGDIQVFAPAAACHFEVAGFLDKWLADLAADQLEDGRVPHVIPNPLGPDFSASSGWADAAVIVPWTLYLRYGDAGVLERQYPSMKAWADWVERHTGADLIWRDGFHFGDWLAPRGDELVEPEGTTAKELIATAFFARSTDLLGRSARVLGKVEDERRYTDQLARIKRAFQAEFVTPGGRVASGTQTAYVLALAFDLLPEELRAQAAHRLVHEIRRRGTRLATGFLGTPWLNHVLTRSGHTDVAYDLLLQERYPSWLYPISKGATTIWERWDGIRPDGTFQAETMNSFNHYAYGAVSDWMVQVIGGIRPTDEAPGYRRVVIAPEPGGGLTWARALHRSMYGEIASAWRLEGTHFELDVSIPTNCSARIRLPRAIGAAVTEGGAELADARGVESLRHNHFDLVISVGAGHYHFAYDSDGLAEAARRTHGIHSPLSLLLNDDRAREILSRHLPEAATALAFRLRAHHSPYQIAELDPVRLPADVLSRLDRDLATLDREPGRG